MSSTKKSPFGDALMCPVCFFEFDGRILQCSQGHAICEKCSLKLTECPYCGSLYCGTRNYVMEDVMAKLRGLNVDALCKKNAAGEDEEVASTKEAPDNADQPILLEPLLRRLSSVDDIMSEYFELESVLIYPKPVQAKGSFICRMLKCGISLPICRMANHIRYHHATHFIEREYLHPTKFTHDLIGIPAKSYRLAIKLKSLGLFFLIFNATKVDSGSSNQYNAWIQCVCPNNDARNYRFNIKMIIGNGQFSYNDMVYGAQSDAAYIEEKKQCFSHSTGRNNRTLDLYIEIYRNTGPKNMPRNSNMIVRSVTPPTSG